MPPKILNPGEMTLDQLTTDQKIMALFQMMQQMGTMLAIFQQTWLNTQPCGKCGVTPPNPILCNKCQEEMVATAQVKTDA